MGERHAAGAGLLSLLVAAFVLSPSAGAGQSGPAPDAPPTAPAGAWTPPKTAWGAPDLDGVWNFGTMTPLERSAAFAGKVVLTVEEATSFERQTIERRANTNATAGPDWWDQENNVLKNRRTSLIVDPADGRIPAPSPEGRARAAATGRRPGRNAPEAPEDLTLSERCILWGTTGPPMMPAVYNNNVQFIQTREYVVIFTEMIHDFRIVPMDGRPHGDVPRLLGDSRGRWEGQTLVVDTVGFTGKTGFRGSSERLHLVERFTRTAADTIEYTYTVEDPSTWTRPWTASLTMTRIPGLIYEYACHEGNERSVIGSLRGTIVSGKAADR
jgi:hypothetical protein